MSAYDFRDACEAGDMDKVKSLIKQVSHKHFVFYILNVQMSNVWVVLYVLEVFTHLIQ